MKLSREDITEIAASIGVQYPEFRAFIDVESGARAFDPKTGRIIIQFEPHIFAGYLDRKGIKYKMSIEKTGTRKIYTIESGIHKLTNGVENQAAEWISYIVARNIDEEAAMLSTSIGLGQIMGFNHIKLGYTSVAAMWIDFEKSEYAQVQGIAAFIANTPGLLSALRTKDWKTVARLYNGTGYAVNRYDLKLAAAYKKYSK